MERVGARFAFEDEAVVITVYYESTTGHPTRIVSENGLGARVCTFTLASADRVWTATRTIQAGSVDYAVPTNLGSRIDFGSDPPNVVIDAKLEAA